MSLNVSNNTFQLDIKTNYTKFWEIIKNTWSLFSSILQYYKAVIKYTDDISSTILQTLQYLQNFHTKSYVKKSFLKR